MLARIDQKVECELPSFRCSHDMNDQYWNGFCVAFCRGARGAPGWSAIGGGSGSRKILGVKHSLAYPSDYGTYHFRGKRSFHQLNSLSGRSLHVSCYAQLTFITPSTKGFKGKANIKERQSSFFLCLFIREPSGAIAGWGTRHRIFSLICF